MYTSSVDAEISLCRFYTSVLTFIVLINFIMEPIVWPNKMIVLLYF